MDENMMAAAEVIGAAFLCLTIISQYLGSDRSVCMKRLKQMSFLTLVWLLADALSYCINYLHLPGYLSASIVAMLPYFMSIAVLIAFLRYSDAYISEYKPLSRWTFRIPEMIAALCAVAVAVWYLTGTPVTVENGAYIVTNYFPVPLLICYIVLLFYAPAVALIKKLGLRSVLLLSFYGIPIIFAAGILAKTGYDFSVLAGSLAVIFFTTLLQKDLAQSKLDESLIFTDYFLGTYSAAYYIGLRDQSWQVYKRTDAIRQKYPVSSAGYFDMLTSYIENDVYPDDRQALSDAVRPDRIRELLAKQAEYTHIYRDISGGEEKNIEMQVIRGADRDHAAVGFSDITAELKEQRRLFLKTEENNRLIESLLNEYNLVYRVSLADASFELFKMDKGIIGEGMEFADFTEARDFFISGVAYPPDRDLLRHELDFDVIRGRLTAEGPYAVEYRVELGGDTIWHEMAVSPLDGDNVAISFGIKDTEILNRHISRSLADDYDRLFIADLNADRLKILKDGGKTIDPPLLIPYSKAVMRFSSVLAGEAKDYFEAASDPSYMKYALQKDGKQEYFFQAPATDGGTVWTKVAAHVLTETDGLPETVVIGTSPADSLQREKMELDSQLRDALDTVTEEKNHFTFVRDLINSAYWSFTIDKNDEIVAADFDGDIMKVLNIDLQIAPHAWETLLHPDDREQALTAFNAAVADHTNRTPYDTVYRMIDKDHHYNWFRSAGQILTRKDGKREFFGIHININSRIEKEQEQQVQLEKALSLAESASRAKTEFLFNISHDIRTPMNAILGFTSMAEKHIDDREKVLDCLSKTHQSGNLLLSLINSVLDVSRIESGSAGGGEKPGDVRRSFASIESTLSAAAAAKDIDLSFGYGEIADPYVYADLDRCIRVFTNLISNAIKYTAPGGCVRARCEQISAPENGTASYRYTVEDNGIGMSEEFQAHMFEAFTREQNSTVSGIQGTGLGLSVCKTFVEYLGGSISCESTRGAGTKFTVILPFRLRDEHDNSGPLPAGTADTRSASEEPADPAALKGRRTLLVEDNELNREIARDLLEEQGILTGEAENGAEAVALLREHGPHYYDFILMDIQMPVMNGYEATKAIRAMYPGEHIPIIALSANAFSEDRAASVAAGMDDHVSKPINTEELFTAIAKAL